jgi:hypothetical protein
VAEKLKVLLMELRELKVLREVRVFREPKEL